MREISPAINLTPEQYFARLSPDRQEKISAIRSQKDERVRPRPSARLNDRSAVLTSEIRRALVDWVAELVDENMFGRSEMCMQFAELLARSLLHLGTQAKGTLGEARYYVDRKEVYRWPHAWVRVGNEVVDGNVDSLYENPFVPDAVSIEPFWGPINETPRDRHLKEHRGLPIPPDDDVEHIWWPELRARIDVFSLA